MPTSPTPPIQLLTMAGTALNIHHSNLFLFFIFAFDVNSSYGSQLSQARVHVILREVKNIKLLSIVAR